MPPRIIPILGRLRQDISADLAKETIEEACRQANYSWRKRVLDPATTIYLFLLQVLHGNTACTHVVHFGNWSFTDSAYCQARKRLPLAVFHWLPGQGRRHVPGRHRGRIAMARPSGLARRRLELLDARRTRAAAP